MPQIGQFDTDYKALVRRVGAHERYGNGRLNDWIFSLVDITEGARVLDLGCGYGNQTIPLIEKGCAVTAVDASSDALAALAKKVSSNSLTIIESKFDDLDLSTMGPFDAVISSYAFYYCKDPKALVNAISKTLISGALFFICGPARRNNLQMKSLLRDVGVEFGEGSAPFMEDILPEIFESVFGNVKEYEFENILTFPSADSVWQYWSSHNMFDSSIEQKFQKKLEELFQDSDSFQTTKVVRGLSAKKS